MGKETSIKFWELEGTSQPIIKFTDLSVIFNEMSDRYYTFEEYDTMSYAMVVFSGNQ
jgi:hypothetical protein